MAAVSLFWDTSMAAVTSCENTLQDQGTGKYVSHNEVSFFFSFFFSYFTFTGAKNIALFTKEPMEKKKTLTKTFRFSVARLLLKTTAFGYVTIQAEKTNLSLCINNKGKVVIRVRCIHCFLLKKMFL